MTHYIKIATLFVLLISLNGFGQNFTRQDTLRGSITPERAWWDLTYYDLKVAIDPTTQTISGENTIHYTVLKSHNKLQFDLQTPLMIEAVSQNGKPLEYTSEGNAHFVNLLAKQPEGSQQAITIKYSGKPKKAVNAPWDGGFSWRIDQNNNPFAATSCQGLGASVWWPNKDHMYDEVDSMRIALIVPKDLVGVANGRLVDKKVAQEKATYTWMVSNPINNYCVNANLGNYVQFGEVYQGEKGKLDLSYYVLPENLEKAKKQFEQVPKMLDAFEHWFGPYPFYEDSFKLVEVPYLGMEHQSSVTYGNQYRYGYLGRDLSGSGWGLKFDFIIIHEAGHEWFANNITYKDIADMWVHEGFTAYSESLYLDYHFGTKAASEYVIGTRKLIQNDRPIIGSYDVNHKGSGDMYYKG
ncbi:MAG: M1 family metallopeptidase, partial [Bacteroidota bacterium]